MQSNPPYFNRAITRTWRYLLSISALILLITFIESCYLVDDDNINAVCPRDCTTVKGRFVTGDGNVPVSNMRIHFNWQIAHISGLSGKTRKIAITETDDNGNYQVTFHALEDELTSGSFSVRYDVPDKTYLSIPNHDYFKFPIPKRDTTMTLDYHLPKVEGSIHIKIGNPEAIGADESIGCNLSYKFGYADNKTQFGFGGLHSPSTVEATYPTASDQYTYIQVLKKKNGEYFNLLDSVIVRPNEVVDYVVTF